MKPRRPGKRALLSLTAILAVSLTAVFNFRHATGSNSGYEWVELNALGYFPFDAESGTLSDIPTRWRALDGKRVRLNGFMYDPSINPTNVREFQFVYNLLQPSGIHGPPQVQGRVFVHVPAGKTVTYSGAFTDLRGILYVNVKRGADGVVTSVYEMDVDSAKDINLDASTGALLESGRWRTWLVLSALAVFLAWAVRQGRSNRRRHQAAAGMCVVCGYDLRATPGRCPECGTASPTTKAKD